MGRAKVVRAALVALGGWLAGCSSSTSSQTNSGAALSSCSMPDAGCMTARGYLSCTSSSGAGQGCLSNDLVQCMGPNPMPGVTFTCQSRCTEREYAASCSSIPGFSGQPPAGCRSSGVTPGGVFYCCPCM